MGSTTFRSAPSTKLWESAVHEWILSVGGEADLGGTGSKALGVESYTTYTPTIYFGKGFGDLPDTLKYVKPVALTGTVGVSIPGESANSDGSFNSDSLELGFALEYSLPYLQQHVEDIGLPKPLRDMIPLVEFTSSSPFDRSGETTTGTVCPGILWEQPDYQIGAEALIPINGHTGPNVGFVFSVQIYIDDLFPKFSGIRSSVTMKTTTRGRQICPKGENHEILTKILYSILLIITSTLARAHAFLDYSEPNVGSTVTMPPSVVKIWFTEKLHHDPRTTIQVFDAAGHEVDRKDAHVDAKNESEMAVSCQSCHPVRTRWYGAPSRWTRTTRMGRSSSR